MKNMKYKSETKPKVQSVGIYYSDGTVDYMDHIKGAELMIMRDNDKICDFHVQGEYHPFIEPNGIWDTLCRFFSEERRKKKKDICGVTGLDCCYCSPCCDHRKQVTVNC